MPTPGPIRKEILSALENELLPALWQNKVPLGCVTPAMQFPAGITVRRLSSTLPRAETRNVDYPLQTRWPRANLHSSRYPYLGFVYSGAIDTRTLVTQAQPVRSKDMKGIYSIHLQAPSILLYPPGTARDGGNIDLWQDPATPQPEMKSMWVSIYSELLIHTHTKAADGRRHISHSLQINDPSALTLANLFMKEMPNAICEDQSYAQAILLAMMLRIQKFLLSGQTKIANTSRSPIPSPKTGLPGELAGGLCHDCAVFIQMHLHEPITLTQIAEQAGLSSAHLNRLFHRQYGVTVMRYVRDQRIAAAQKILESGPENVAEIAALVGFKRASAFCDIFRRETGLTPNQFRRRARRSKITTHTNNVLQSE